MLEFSSGCERATSSLFSSQARAAAQPIDDDRCSRRRRRDKCPRLDATKARLAELRRPIARAVGRVLGASHPDFDDTVQLALIASAEALPALRGECHQDGYVGRIASRIAVRARHRSRYQRRPREALMHLADQIDAGGCMTARARRARCS